MADLLCQLIQLYVLVIIVGALLSWFPSRPGSGLYDLRRFVARFTDPVMMPVRRAIGASMGGIDFSPLIVIIGLQLLAGTIC